MSTPVPASGSGPRNESGAALPSSAAHPASPGPNPDDLDEGEATEGRGADAVDPSRDVAPTTPGPNPDDIND
ncbi:hypothetical protein [Cellulomonas sp. Marseille-Q8402]